MELRNIRLEKKLTQEKAANLLGVSRRTYIKYENGDTKLSDLKLKFLCSTLEQYGFIDEEHGILALEDIKNKCEEVFKQYDVEYCYLFGSYAKGNAKENSDIDLLVSTPVNDINFFGLIEDLRQRLKKKIDLLDVAQLNNNMALIQEILKEGIKIYG